MSMLILDFPLLQECMLYEKTILRYAGRFFTVPNPLFIYVYMYVNSFFFSLLPLIVFPQETTA